MKTFFVLCCCICINAAFAQAPKRFTAPLSGTVTLKNVEDKYNAQVYNMEMPEPDAADEFAHLAKIKEQVSKLFPHKHIPLTAKTTSVPTPVVSRGFVADSFPGIPPDNYVGVNKHDTAVSVINSTIAVLNAANGQMFYRKTLKIFSNVVALNNAANDYRYDPKIIFDPEADRFICVMLNGTNDHNWLVIGFSQTSDPSGNWNFYKLYGNYASDTTWFDYPTIAMTHDEFFLTGNKLVFNGSFQTGFVKSVIYEIKKSDGYAASSTLNYQIWDSVNFGGRPIRNIFPVKGGNSLHGPAQYFLNVRNVDIQNDTVFLIKLSDTIGSSSQALTVTPLVSNLNYGVPPDGRQTDPNYVLQTNDGRVLGAYAEGSEIQFVTTSVVTGSGAAGIYHGIIHNYTTAPSVQASMITVDTLDFGYPNISYTAATAGSNQSIISFNYTGPGTYAGLGAVFFDGSQYSPLLKVKTGDSIIRVLSGSGQRWGDYTGSQPDWSAIGCVWIEGIYARKDRNYGNYMARLRSPYYTAVPTENDDNIAGEKLYPNPACQFIRMEFDLKKDALISFMIYNSQGQKIEEILQTKCEEGHNFIQFNTASLLPGVYYLSAADGTGKQVMKKSFVRQ